VTLLGKVLRLSTRAVDKSVDAKGSAGPQARCGALPYALTKFSSRKKYDFNQSFIKLRHQLFTQLTTSVHVA
jgi:hypothetical protein